MAKRTVAQNLRVEDNCRWIWYYGGKLDLIAAGVIPDIPLPGEAGCPRKMCMKLVRPDGREVAVQRSGKRGSGRFRAVVSRTPDEIAVLEAVEARKEALHRREDSLRWRDERIARLPRSGEEYLRIVVSALAGVLNINREGMVPGWGGYRVTQSTLEDMDRAACELIKAVKGGRTIYDDACRRRDIAKITSEAAKRDPAAAAFMQAIVQKETGDATSQAE